LATAVRRPSKSLPRNARDAATVLLERDAFFVGDPDGEVATIHTGE
jgi:hypothetical protein